jgi:hypothetical protein
LAKVEFEDILVEATSLTSSLEGAHLVLAKVLESSGMTPVWAGMALSVFNLEALTGKQPNVEEST